MINSVSCLCSIPVWEDDDLTGQCLVFFFAGFDAASTLLCFIGHELAINPEVQAKLVEEVDDFKVNLDGKSMSYETINKMNYLDMVVSGEWMRESQLEWLIIMLLVLFQRPSVSGPRQ